MPLEQQAEQLRLARRPEDQLGVVETLVHPTLVRSYESHAVGGPSCDTPLVGSAPCPRRRIRSRSSRARSPGRAASRWACLGAFTVSPDGERVVYLRTKTGDDPVSCLWVFEVSGAKERLVFDPGEEEAERDLTEAERARRERARERSSGVTAYATDEAVRRAVFTVGGPDVPRRPGRGIRPRAERAGSRSTTRAWTRPAERIAFVVEGTLHVREIEGGVRELASPDAPDTYWGLAEFVAAEEMDRNRGHWWSPDGSKLAAAHVDEREVSIRYLSDPTDPAAEPRAVRYPEAGSNNAVVTLWVFDVESGERVEVRWDLEAFPYLARVTWGHEPLTLLVQTRDQRTVRLLEADPASGRDLDPVGADGSPMDRARRGRAGPPLRRPGGRRRRRSARPTPTC